MNIDKAKFRGGYSTEENARRAARDYIVSMVEMLDNLENATPSEQFDATLKIESMAVGMGRAIRARFDYSRDINSNE